MNTEKKTNYFIRFLVFLVSCLLVAMILFNFFINEPKGIITGGLILLILILIILVLSESFDNFSIGKIFSISREIKKKEIEISKLSNDNEKLRSQLVTIACSINQHQSSTNIFGFSDDMIKKIIVQKANEDEIKEKEADTALEAANLAVNKEGTITTPPRRPNYRKIEQLSINKFINDRNLQNYNLITEAKLVTQFHGIDPISNVQPIFDGYINTGDDEIFIEVKPSHSISYVWRDRLYVMLNKIHLYRSIKKVNAYLVLILTDIPTDENDRKQRYLNQVDDFFEPALTNSLLRIITIKFSKDEINNLEEE